jgi:cysteine desulfurase
MIYLDNNATTRVAPEVFDAMRPFFNEFYGNPSSAHTLGRGMKHGVERAREQVAALIGAADAGEIVFTSCGSEADNWAIRGVLEQNPQKQHIVTTRVEHEAVRNYCALLETRGYAVTWLEVDEKGLLNLEDVRAALRPDTALVSVMLAQNETGVLFPIEEIGRVVRENSDALFHVDAVQAVGKVPLDVKNWDVDLLALSGHKLHAPQGVGALYVRSGVELAPFIVGGKQEAGRRAGTSAVPSVVGLGAACELARTDDKHHEIKRLRDKLEEEILSAFPNARVNGDRAQRLVNTANISFCYLEGESIMARLDAAGIAVSTGSACHSSSRTASPTLAAMGVPYTQAQGSIRFSLGRYNTAEEITQTLAVLRETIAELSAMSPYNNELAAMAAGR